MVDHAVMNRKLAQLEEYLQDLADAKEKLSWEEFQQDKVIRRYVERTLHLAIEACLDLAGHVISYEGFREPADNKDTFLVLYEQRHIDKVLMEKLMKMAQFRNVIVHDYARIQPEIVYAVLSRHTEDIREFAVVMCDIFVGEQ